MIWLEAQPPLDAELDRAAQHDTIAVDTEADSFHSYFDKVCLIQVTAGNRDLLIDPLVELDLDRLGVILEDQSKTKLLHGADYDLRILGRDFGFRIRNLIDTMICAQLLGEPSIGLAALLGKYLGVELDKVHQRADWSRRPLPEPMRVYAAKDTHHLAELTGILQKQLEDKGRWAWAREEFERLEEVKWSPPEDRNDGWRKLKGSGRLDPRSMEVLRLLYEWRDREARNRDVPPFRVISNEALMTIATERPLQREELSKVKGVSPGLLRRYGNDLLHTTRAGLATLEDDLPEKIKAKPWKPDRRVEQMVDRLRKVRNHVAEELGIEPSIVAPKHLLTAIAEKTPRNYEELGEIDAMRRWQIEVAGTKFLEVI